MIGMQKSQQVFSSGQQSKFQQLQLEVAALEEQLKNVLNESTQLTDNYSLHSPIPLIYVDDRIAKTGIRLAHETR
jgi:hypothetical protein